MLLFFINLFCPYLEVSAQAEYKNIRRTNLQTFENNNMFGLVEKDSKRVILPLKYKKIRKTKFENKIIIAAENPLYLTLYSPDGIYDDFFSDYFENNNYIQNIKFENYPKNGAVKYKQNSLWGLIIVNNGIVTVTKPIYKKIIFPDEASIVSKILNITYAPLNSIILYSKYSNTANAFQTAAEILNNSSQYHSGNVLFNAVKINEELQINDNNLTVKYKSFDFYDYNYFLITQKDNLRLFDCKTGKEQQYLNINIPKYKDKPSINSLSQLYDFINKNSQIKVKNYPQKGILKKDNKLYAFNNSQMKELPLLKNYDLSDSNLLISKLTGLSVYFSDYDKITAKNGGWGILDNNGKIKVPFIYDSIMPLENDTLEMIHNMNKVDTESIELEFIPKDTENNLYLAQKGRNYGIINENNEVIIPFKYVKYSENNNIGSIKAQMNNRINREISEYNRKETINTLPWLIADIILFPLLLIIPYPCSSIHFHGRY